LIEERACHRSSIEEYWSETVNEGMLGDAMKYELFQVLRRIEAFVSSLEAVESQHHMIVSRYLGEAGPKVLLGKLHMSKREVGSS
jgi:hypothetical protein